jgi:hypothetical protein
MLKPSATVLLAVTSLLATTEPAAAQFSAPETSPLPGVIATNSPNKTTVLATFDTPGVYTWTVPPKVKTVTFDVFGASGGNVVVGNVFVATGGAGEEATATFAVQPGQLFEVVVGGAGAAGGGGDGGAGSGVGGSNGGAAGGSGTFLSFGGAGGGGSSDVRIGGLDNSCASDHVCTLPDRIVVGGGGGGDTTFDSSLLNGGAGGGASGQNHTGYQDGGTQEQGGIASTLGTNGSFGNGGLGSVSSGGGGGGWYGGASDYQIGGGGGSGFISGVVMKASFSGGTRTGDGLVTISTP